MSVTPLLCVNDVLHHVIFHIAADIEVEPTLDSYFPSSPSNLRSNAARGNLARLARVHSNLTQPALAALWRFLLNDGALKHLLWVIRIDRDGSDQSLAEELQKNKRNHDNPPLESRGTVTSATHGSSAWTRFQKYASLVRAIAIDPSVRTFNPPSKLLQDTFWYRISSALGDTPILPRLRAATIFSAFSFNSFDFDMGLLSLLNPSVRELNLLLPGVGRGERSNFQKVLSSCLPSGHDLEALSVVVPVPLLNLESLPHLYPRLRRLKVDEDGIQPSNLAPLGTLPNLESLSIILNDSTPLEIPVAFAELRSLEIFGGTFIGKVGLLIAHLDAPKLRSLSISEADPVFDKSFPHESQSHLRTVVRKYPFLSAFRWVSRDPLSARPGDLTSVGMALAEFLDPLLSLRAMRTFSASFNAPFIAYSSADFQKIAEAWPDIETFDLSIDGSGTNRYADLEALASFARNCPRLHELRIPSVNFDPDASTAVVGPPTPHFLRELKVANVVLPTEQYEDATHQRKLLSDLIKQIFPSANIRFPPIKVPLRSGGGYNLAHSRRFD